jgi:hypothetical protein
MVGGGGAGNKGEKGRRRCRCPCRVGKGACVRVCACVCVCMFVCGKTEKEELPDTGMDVWGGAPGEGGGGVRGRGRRERRGEMSLFLLMCCRVGYACMFCMNGTR